MNSDDLLSRYADLQRYVGWTAEDAQCVAAAASLVRPEIPSLLEDFYAEIQRHPRAAAVITGGPEQIQRLKLTLGRWIEQLLAGSYDQAYVEQRASAGRKHVEIGLEQVYVSAALSRLRSGLAAVISRRWRGTPASRTATLTALHKLLDLDAALIATVYEEEHVRREQASVRLQLESLVHQHREFSEGLLAHAPGLVLVLDLQGRIVRLSSQVEQLQGVAASAAVGRDWLTMLVPRTDHNRARRQLFEQVLKEPGRAGSETTGLIGDGPRHQRQVRWASTLLRDAAGQPFAVLVLGQDITDVKDAQDRALRAERLAAIGQMATGLAHEARNALQRIQASAEMLELELEHQPDSLAFVRRIEQAQQHLHCLFEEVRGYAGPIKLDRAVCRLAPLWHEAWDILAAQRAGRSATLRESLGATQCEAAVDRFRLVQVFRNILENALAACANPVEIEITCQAAAVGAQAGVQISIADNGPGMSTEQRRRICEPFFTTKPTGTGLGMAIVQRLIEAHGGTVAVGERTAGAEILISLPLKAA